jgi:hypothetical protein
MPKSLADLHAETLSTPSIDQSSNACLVLANDESVGDIDRLKGIALAIKVGKGVILRQLGDGDAIVDEVALEVQVVRVGNEVSGRGEDGAVLDEVGLSEKVLEGEVGVVDGDGDCVLVVVWALVVRHGESDGVGVLALLRAGRGTRESGGGESQDCCIDGLHFDGWLGWLVVD